MDDIEVCRLCLKSLHNEKLSLLNSPYSMMLEAFAAIRVENNSLLPTASCKQCIKDLELSYTFRQNIIQADRSLREHIREKKMKSDDNQDTVCSVRLLEGISYEFQIDGKIETCRTPGSCETVKNVNATIIDVENMSTPTINVFDPIIFDFTNDVKYSICPKDISDSKIYEENMMTDCIKLQACENYNVVVDDAKESEKRVQEEHNYVALNGFHCAQCRLSFKYKAFYDAHIKEHSDVAKSSANEQKRSDFSHISSKTTSKPSNRRRVGRLKQCQICYAYVSSYNLYTHVKIHTTGPQICKLCGATSRNEVSLRSHMRYTHSKLCLRCDICGREFKKQYLLTLHKKKHDNNKDHICEICGRKFFTMFTLLEHTREVHMKVTRYSCIYCEKKFFSRLVWKTHLLTHTNEKPYKCDLCSSSFTQKVSLRTHRKSIHNIQEVTDVPCTECGKMFGSTHAVISHMRVHK